MACAALQSSWMAAAEALHVGPLAQPVALVARQAPRAGAARPRSDVVRAARRRR